jgi:hypothetical protein
MRARVWLKTRRAVVAMGFVLFFSILLNSPRWFESSDSMFTSVASSSRAGAEMFQLQWELHRNPNILMQENYRFYYHGLTWILFMYGIPIPLLSVLNFKIWKQV